MKALALFFCLTLPAAAQFANTASANRPAPPSPNAVIPAPLLSAKSVFISNAGADSGLFPQPFSGTPDRAYTAFYSAIQSWGHYTLVSDPTQADLVFEIQLTAPNGPTKADKQYGASDPLPMFRLVVYQQKSHYILWALTETVNLAFLQKTHDRNFDQAMTTLVSNLQAVVTPTKP